MIKTNTQIEIMYADFSRRSAPILRAATLPRDGVLFLWVYFREDDQPYHHSRLIETAHSKDFYGLVIEKDGFYIDSYDESEEYLLIRKFDVAGAAIKRKRSRGLPKKVVIFEGGYVSPERWEIAKQLFDEAIG